MSHNLEARLRDRAKSVNEPFTLADAALLAEAAAVLAAARDALDDCVNGSLEDGIQAARAILESNPCPPDVP